MHSNCRAWTRRQYLARRREWSAAGRPIGFEPYKVTRPTRLRIAPTWYCPKWLCDWITDRIPHDLIGAATLEGYITVRGILPVSAACGADVLTPLQLLRVLWFEAREVNHDRPK